MSVKTSHHIEIDGEEYLLKTEAATPFVHGYDDIYVTRQSTSEKWSEGSYARDLVNTQTSWRNGEGAKYAGEGTEEMYWSSEDIDISGTSAPLRLLKGVEDVSSTLTYPLSTNAVNVEVMWDGIRVSYPTNSGAGSQKYAARWTGSAWDFESVLPAAMTPYSLYGMATAQGYLFLLFAEAVYRSDDWTTAWHTTVDSRVMGSDGTYVYVATGEENSQGYTFTNYYQEAADGAAGGAFGTSVSESLDGTPVLHSMTFHNGTMYCLAYDASGDRTYVHRFDGDNFVLWKVLPDGFRAQGCVSDGSVLYITGYERCAEGNLRGQIYYITGSSASESVGRIGGIGERDGSSNYTMFAPAAHGNSLYFPYSNYGGVGRYDAIYGGISKSYRESSFSGDITRVRVYDGDLYFLAKGSGATETTLYRVKRGNNAGDYVGSGTIDSSYIDYGLLGALKLFTSIEVQTSSKIPADSDGVGGDIHLYYKLDGAGGGVSWQSLGSIGDGERTVTGDGYKYKVALPGNGVKAYSLAYRLELIRSSENAGKPEVKASSVNGMVLMNAPGMDRPKHRWKFSVVLSDQMKTRTGAIEKGRQSALLNHLKEIYEGGGVCELKTFAEPDTSYNAVIMLLTDVAASKSRSTGYEATVDLELLEVG